jgi:hypothetical protein
MIIDTHDLRYNTATGQLEYDSGAEIWLPAAPPGLSGYGYKDRII